MSSLITEHKMQEEIPEIIEEYLEYQHGLIKCIAFNHRGTLLAAGCSNGVCVIWDFETRVIAKLLKDEDRTAAITSVCWSKYGHYILVSTGDTRLILWNVSTGEKVAQLILGIMPLRAQLRPVASVPSLCLVSPVYSVPFTVDLITGNSTVLPVSLSGGGPCCFNCYGDLVYMGDSMGKILLIDHHNAQIRAVVFSSRGDKINDIVFSQNGMYLLTNSSDGTIRVYKNTLPLIDGLKVLYEMGEMLNNLRDVGAKSLVLCHEIQGTTTRTLWKVPRFSRKGEWIISGCSNVAEHKIYIWDDVGHLVKILTGPKEGMIDLAWHPVHAIVVSLSSTGLVYVWARNYTKKWSSFYPNFKELDKVEEYVEREDEFDIMPEIMPGTRQVKERDVSNDGEADIVTVENDSVFSDSEMSEEELCFLPSIPFHDTLEPQDKCTRDSLKSSDIFHAIIQDSCRMEGTDDCHDFSGNVTHGPRSKRQRKPTEKLMELMADMARKPAKKMNWPNTGA